MREVDVDDDALDHGYVFVADEGVLPGLECGWPLVTGTRYISPSCAGPAGRWRFSWSRATRRDGAVASLPSGVVGGVAEVLYAVGGELSLFAGGDVAYPEVLVADECGLVLSGEMSDGVRFLPGAARSLASDLVPVDYDLQTPAPLRSQLQYAFRRVTTSIVPSKGRISDGQVLCIDCRSLMFALSASRECVGELR